MKIIRNGLIIIVVGNKRVELFDWSPESDSNRHALRASVPKTDVYSDFTTGGETT